jgi:hypothetical protein
VGGVQPAGKTFLTANPSIVAAAPNHRGKKSLGSG